MKCLFSTLCVYVKLSTRNSFPFVLSPELLYNKLQFDNDDGEITGEVGVD
jgi:hypothetical protein